MSNFKKYIIIFSVLLVNHLFAQEKAPAEIDFDKVQEFTIATQNLWIKQTDYSQREKNFEKRIKEFLPSIVAFQEASKIVGGGSFLFDDNSERSLYKYFVNKTKYKGTYCKMSNLRLYEDAIATLSTFPQEEFGCFGLPGSDNITKRKMAILKIKIGGQMVVVLNVHLSPFDVNECVRAIQVVAQQITEKYSDSKVIVLGDFNIPFDPTFMKPLTDMGFKNVDPEPERLKEGETGANCTFCKENPFNDSSQSKKIDFIFYKETDFKLEEFGIWGKENPISDHEGVWAKFKLIK